MTILQEKQVKEENRINRKSLESKVKKNKISKKIRDTILILIIIGVLFVGVLLYGQYSGFREWLITSSMTTMRHQWIAQVIYDEDTINKVMEDNRVDEVDEETNVNAIIVEIDSKDEYANEYEREILEKQHPNDKYKIIKVSGKGYSGYLAVIYDPSKIQTLVSGKIGTSGQYLTTMAKNNNAIVAINGGGFDDPNHSSNAANPLGVTYSKGKMITNYDYIGAGGIIGFDKNNKLVLSSNCTASSAEKLGIRDCVTCGPFLIVNGKPSTVLGNGGWGTAPRTAIGQRQDGIVLWLVLDGRTLTMPGADMNDLIEIMQKYGAYNAANLDGGTSSVLVVDNKIVNDPIDSTGAHKTRFISTGFGLIDK